MITYQLHKNGVATGRTQRVPEPHEVRGVRAQGRQRRVISKLDESTKWVREGAAPVDFDSEVERRVAEALAARESGQDEDTSTKPTTRRRRTKAASDETPAE